MAENSGSDKELRSLALTPTWSVATVLTIFVVVSLVVEHSIHRLSNCLRKTNRKPLLAAVEKMKEELMLLGFISLFLTATSSTIANIWIPSKFYDSTFAPCTRNYNRLAGFIVGGHGKKKLIWTDTIHYTKLHESSQREGKPLLSDTIHQTPLPKIGF
ncbi:hypothetical protein SLEP1_g46270 [Rubroshorea leprosula]|uniref:Uncharacterized protein n=1 Tax=Rubroshorea leprosula TaxID=152421 RepID=A0AAV5LME9_9ROSI|nr:hypothetical protein SLEP1_g46270 [Rubroshorea leprosula]